MLSTMLLAALIGGHHHKSYKTYCNYCAPAVQYATPVITKVEVTTNVTIPQAVAVKTNLEELFEQQEAMAPQPVKGLPAPPLRRFEFVKNVPDHIAQQRQPVVEQAAEQFGIAYQNVNVSVSSAINVKSYAAPVYPVYYKSYHR